MESVKEALDETALYASPLKTAFKKSERIWIVYRHEPYMEQLYLMYQHRSEGYDDGRRD